MVNSIVAHTDCECSSVFAHTALAHAGSCITQPRVCRLSMKKSELGRERRGLKVQVQQQCKSNNNGSWKYNNNGKVVSAKQSADKAVSAVSAVQLESEETGDDGSEGDWRQGE